MSEYKLFVQRIGLVGITNILVSISSIILLPILTKNLTIQDYGVWGLFVTTMSFIPLVVNLGLPFSMVRFLPVKKDKEEIKEEFYSIMFVLLFVGIITSIIVLIFSKQIALTLFDGNVAVAVLLSLSVIINMVNVSFISFLRTFQQMKVYSMITLLQTYVTVGLVILIVESGYKVAGVVAGNVLMEFIMLILVIAFVVHEIGFKFPRFKNIKEYLSFGIHTVPGNLSNWLVDLSDRYVIGILLGTAFVGYYSPGYTLGNLIAMFLAPFSFLLPPLLSSYYDQNRMDEVKLHLDYSFKYFLLISIPSVFGLSILSKPLLTILSTPEIAQHGYLITPFVALSALLLGIYGIIGQMLILEKKTKVIGLIWMIAAVINLGLNVISVPFFGIVAAAISTLISYGFVCIVASFYSLKNIELDFNMNFILKSLFASVIMSSVIIWINPVTILGIIMTIVICSVVYILILLLLKGISRTEIEFFKKIVKE